MKYMNWGKTVVTDNGVTFLIYDRERTICDIFKHRNKIDNETFNKALNAYVKDDKKNLNNLFVYAKKTTSLQKSYGTSRGFAQWLILPHLCLPNRKIKLLKVAKAITFVCSSSVKKSFCV